MGRTRTELKKREMEKMDCGKKRERRGGLRDREVENGQRELGSGETMVCLEAAQWMLLQAQCSRGEGRRGELMVGGCGEVRRTEGSGSQGHCSRVQSVIR